MFTLETAHHQSQHKQHEDAARYSHFGHILSNGHTKHQWQDAIKKLEAKIALVVLWCPVIGRNAERRKLQSTDNRYVAKHKTARDIS